ncbi:MAG: CHASE2 domain-containing protein, partial [Candidatus Marinimicrobia bacterium]|nr:CHASE2 domain-containing protein [Candidatus Neomarinimicrobiota bacterium]
MDLKKFILAHGAGLLWTGASILVTVFLYFTGLFNGPNYKLLDFAFAQIRGPLAGRTARTPIDRDSLKVVLVDVDDESWRLIPYSWPYPRDAVWARVVRNLTNAGARVIAFDMEFDSPDKKSNDLEELNRQGYDIKFQHGDDVLAEAMRYAQSRGTRIVLASKLVSEPTRMPPEYIMMPVERIMAADPETGLINEQKDRDGTTRKYALFYEMNHEPGTWYLSLGLKALKEYWQLPDNTIPTLHMENNEINYGPATIKTYGRSASFLINYYGPPSGTSLPGHPAWKTFDRYPLSNIVDDAEFDLRYIEEDTDWMDLFDPNSEINMMMQMFDPEYEVPESPFRDKIVLIGVSVNVLLDVKETPYYNYAGIQQLMPGVEFHANAVQTILDENFIKVVGGTIEYTRRSITTNLIIIVVLALITFLLILRLSPVLGGVIVMVQTMIFVDLSLGFFTADFFWLPKLVGVLVLPRALVESMADWFLIGTPEIGGSMYVPVMAGIASIILTYGSNVIYRFILEQRDKHFLKDTFGTYISPELIEQMYEQKQMPSLGGESGVRTAY